MTKKDYRHVRKATVVRKPSGQTIRLGGYRPDKANTKDKQFQSKRFSLEELPPLVDLRPYMTPVENQGQSNSCTANAMAGAYEYLANRLTGQADDVSRLFIYYNARNLDGDTAQDQGTYLRSCIKVLRKYGTCSERTWPFDLNRILKAPHSSAYEEAANFLIQEAARVDVDLDTMRSCLAEGYPFAFGLQLFSSFQTAGANGLVPMPDPDREQHDGGHAMLCVGYSDADKVFIVRNSWGEDWGDKGYCYIPYAYITHPQLNGDCWTVRHISSSDVDLSQGIHRNHRSLFDARTAEIATAFQVPGVAEDLNLINFFDSLYEVTYEEQQVYVNGEFVSVDEIEDLEALYYLEYEEEYEEESEEYESEEYEEEYEETEDSYDENSVDEEYEEEYEETEDSYDEDEDEEEDDEDDDEDDDEEEDDEDEEDEEEDDEDDDETEDSYDEDDEDEEEEDDDDSVDDEEDDEEDGDDEEEYDEEEETEDSYDEEDGGEESYDEGDE